MVSMRRPVIKTMVPVMSAMLFPWREDVSPIECGRDDTTPHIKENVQNPTLFGKKIGNDNIKTIETNE